MFLWTRGKHFLQLRRKNFARRPKKFRSMSENDEKINVFTKIIFPQNVPIDT